MLKTLVNAFKNKDIRKKLLYTLMMLVVVRIGSLLPIPGVDTEYFSTLLSDITSGDMSYLNAFTGGSFEKMSLFALSITPYITSSIIMQLLTIANRSKPFSVLWPGTMIDGKLVYAEDRYADYKEYDVERYDITCVV